MDRQQEFVLRTIEERDIRFVRLWFTDVLGILKSVAVAPAELEGAFAEGIGFDGSAIEGLTRVYEADMLAKPDPTTFQVLPWRGENPGTARMFCDILLPDRSPSFADSRNVLKRALAKAADHGFTFYTHPEIEFYLFEQPTARRQPPVPVDQGGYFDHVPHGTAHDFRRAAITMLESMGISVEFSHHEAGPGQNEIDLRYADALTTADNIMTFRTVIKEVALEQGVFASLHAQAARRPPRLRHAHAPVAVRGRPQRLPRGRRAVPAQQGRAAVHRRPAAARRRDHRGHQPVGELLQAAVGRRRGAGATSAGVTTTAPRWSGCRCTSRARASRTRIEFRVARLGVQPVPRVRRAAHRRPQGHRGGLRAARRAPRTTSGR